jgi:AcrR family transcriptional regulator
LSRTRSPDYDSIQELILERTADLFAARGYVASSISDIADACDCSKSRLYHYFDSKESILIAMLTEHVDGLLQGSREIVAKYADPMERFTEITRYFMDNYVFSRSRHVVLLTCLRFLPEAVQRELIDKQRELVSQVRNILKSINADRGGGGITDIDTMLFFGMINWTYTWYRVDGTVPPRALADRCVAIFLEGYRTVSSAAPAEVRDGSVGRNSRRPGVRAPV